MKRLGEIKDLVTAFYTCNPDDTRIQFGGWDKATAGVKDDVHRIKTRSATSWDLQLKRVFMNGEEIYNQYTTDVQRKVLFDPNFSHIHIPMDDFNDLQRVILSHHDAHSAQDVYTCAHFLAGQQGCYYKNTACAEIDSLPPFLWKIRVGTYGNIK